jgi:thioredoxin-like negative regulator of GroEL
MKKFILLITLSFIVVLVCSVTVGFTVKQDEPKPITWDEFTKIVSNKNKTVLVYFHADWCAPCVKMQPIIDKVSTENESQMELLLINPDRDREVKEELEIDGLPVTMFYKNGVLKWSYVGLMKESDLKKKLGYYIVIL